MIRKVLLSSAVLAAVAAYAAPRLPLADSPHSGQYVAVEAARAFIPVGFDDNDETLLVLDGYLPSGCYRLTRPETAVDQEAKTITVTPMARYFDVPCIEARVPFHYEVRLGILAAGDYTVKVNDGNAVLRQSLSIAESTTAGPDDYLYAPVDDVTVRPNADTGHLEAVLQGRFTRACLDWEDVRVEDNGDTVNVLPIMHETDPNACTDAERVYKKIVPLPDSITPGRHLLHVRSLNGQAVNFLFEKSAR
jgi:hypothetical protein